MKHLQALALAAVVSACATSQAQRGAEADTSRAPQSAATATPSAGGLELQGASPQLILVNEPCRPDQKAAKGAEPKAQVEVGLAAPLDGKTGKPLDPALYGGSRCD